MFEQVDVAAISFVPEKFGLENNSDRLEEMYRKAAAGGAQLAVAPEGVLEGYVVSPIIAGEVSADRMSDVAVTMRSSVIRRFRALAKELKISLAFGLAERVGKQVYNCAVFIDHMGHICGKYHKMQLAEGSHRSWWFNRLGQKSRACKTPFGRCGFLICNDRWNPDIARIPVLDGAQFLLIPSFGSRSRAQDKAVLARGRENGVPIVEANVGVTLIISKGEIVQVSRKETTITFGTVDIPAQASGINRDRQERSFLRWRQREMPVRYKSYIETIEERKKDPKHRSTRLDSRGGFISS